MVRACSLFVLHGAKNDAAGSVRQYLESLASAVGANDRDTARNRLPVFNWNRQRARAGAKWFCHALILLLLASPVAAQDVPQKLAIGGYLTSAFFDASITSFCSGAQTCHEQNPLLKPIVERRGVVAAMTVKGAMHAGITLGLLRLSKGHPKRTFWLTVALTAAQVAVDVANVRTLRK